MDTLISTFATPVTLFICLVAYVLTYFFRRTVEGVWKIAKKGGKPGIPTRIYNEVFLPIFPILVGGLMGLMAKTFIWPDITNGSIWGRIFYGALCGFFSSFAYNRVRAWVSSKIPSGQENKVPFDLPPIASDPEPPTGV